MLGKLIKYDFKSVSKTLIIIHGFLLVLAMFARFVIIGPAINKTVAANSIFFQATVALVTITGIVAFIGAIYGTYIILGVRYFRNMYSDEGYLTHTLPVKKETLFLSKVIVGSAWTTINMIVVITAICILAGGIPYSIIEEVPVEFRSMVIGYVVWTIVLMLAAAVSGIIMLYSCISIGDKLFGHRAIGAIATYFAVSTVVGVLSTVINQLIGLMFSKLDNGFSLGMISNNGDAMDVFNRIINTVLSSAMIMEIVVSAILWIIAIKLLKKNINLA